MPVIPPSMATGVYCIQHVLSKKRYIGSSGRDVHLRIREHRNKLRRGVHENPYLQSAWDKYKEEAFEFFVIQYCSSADCVSREQYWIDYYRSSDKAYGYNSRLEASSNLGMEKTKTKECRCKYCGSTFIAADVKASICEECSRPRSCLCGCGEMAKSAKHPYKAGHASRTKTAAIVAGRKMRSLKISGSGNTMKSLVNWAKAKKGAIKYWKNLKGVAREERLKNNYFTNQSTKETI